MQLDSIKQSVETVFPAVGEGLADAIHVTWSDLGQGAGSLAADPLKTTGKYLRDHAVDLAAGAVIGFVNPRGMANVMLVAWSLRGLASTVWGGLRDAGADSADTSSVANRVREAVSHEGTAFISAMPMAMVGGMMGKSAAGAVFGRGHGALDLTAGRVTGAQAKENLLALSEAVRPPRVKLVITDLDGTAFPLMDYLVPALRQNLAELSAKSAMSREGVIRATGGMTLSPWLLETSPLARRFKGTSLEFQERVVEPFWNNLSESRARHLRPYEGVEGTIAELNRRGIDVVALTNAPAHLAVDRVLASGLDGAIKEVYATASTEPKIGMVVDAAALEHGRALVEGSLARKGRLDAVWSLPEVMEKPDPRGLAQILRDRGLRPKEALFIGDSLYKDGLPAEANGVPYVWARYGRYVPAEYRQFLRGLRNVSEAGGPRVRAPERSAPPTVAKAPSFATVLDHLEPKADYFQLSRQAVTALMQKPSIKPLMAYDLFKRAEQRGS